MQKRVFFSLIHNWRVKLASVLVAFSLWAWQSATQIREKSINVPVVYKNMPKGFVFTNNPHRFIKVKLTGREENLNFSTSALKAEVDLADANITKKYYKVIFNNAQLPESIRLSGFPERLQVLLEQVEEKTITISVRIVGKPNESYRLGRVTLRPARITIAGPKSELSNIKEVSAGTINVAQMTQSINRRLPIRLSENITILGAKNAVDVRVPFIPLSNTIERTMMVSIVPIALDSFLKASLSVEKVGVQLQGERSALKKLNASDISVTINLGSTHFNPRTNRILPYDNEPNIPIEVTLKKYQDKIAIVQINPDHLDVNFSPKNPIGKKPPLPDNIDEGGKGGGEKKSDKNKNQRLKENKETGDANAP